MGRSDPINDILHTALHSLSETLFVADRHLSSIEYVSKELSQVVSRPLPEMSSLSDLWTTLVAPADREHVQQTIRSATTDGREADVDYRVVTKGAPGEQLWLSLRLVPMHSDTGTTLRFTGILRDRTEEMYASLRVAQAEEQEILIGARIQRTLLLARPEVDAVRMNIAVQTLPTQSIDGDFYDFFRHGTDVFDVIIGDVMGKGVSAALMGAAVKNAILRSMLEYADTSSALPSLPGVVARTEMKIGDELRAIGRFVTMYACRFDTAESALEYVDCGHTYIVHHRREDGTAWVYDGINMPIGFAARQDFVSFRMPLDEGDVIFLYSDGLSETRNSENQLFGEDRIMHYLVGHAGQNPETLLSGLLSIVFDFSAQEIRDDVTGIIARLERPIRRSVVSTSRSFPVNTRLVDDVRRFTSETLATWRLNELQASPVLFAVHEAVANIWVHDYGRAARSNTGIAVRLELRGDWLYVTVTYRGSVFQIQSGPPSHKPTFDTATFSEHGYGLKIMHTVMDSIVLCRGLSDQLRLVMAKNISRPPGG